VNVVNSNKQKEDVIQKEIVQQENRRLAFENIQYIDDYANSGFILKEYIAGRYPEDDRIIIEFDGEDKEITKYEFENLWIGVGYEKERIEKELEINEEQQQKKQLEKQVNQTNKSNDLVVNILPKQEKNKMKNNRKLRKNLMI
jgi:hypothetical protein